MICPGMVPTPMRIASFAKSDIGGEKFRRLTSTVRGECDEG